MKKTRTKRVAIACDRAYRRGRADMAQKCVRLCGEIAVAFRTEMEAMEARVKALEGNPTGWICVECGTQWEQMPAVGFGGCPRCPEAPC